MTNTVPQLYFIRYKESYVTLDPKVKVLRYHRRDICRIYDMRYTKSVSTRFEVLGQNKEQPVLHKRSLLTLLRISS